MPARLEQGHGHFEVRYWSPAHPYRPILAMQDGSQHYAKRPCAEHTAHRSERPQPQFALLTRRGAVMMSRHVVNVRPAIAQA